MRRLFWVWTVLAVIATGCAHHEGTDLGPGSTTTAAAASTTTTTTAPTTTTTAGLGTRVLTFGLEADRLDKFTATLTYVIDLSASGSIPGAADISGLSTITVKGRMWRLILAGPSDGTFEVIEDFRPDSGTIVFKSGSTTVNQDLDQYDLATYGGILGAYVIDDSGERVDELGGTPAFYSLNPTVSDPLSSFGPVLPPDPLGVGDGWSTTASVPVIGDVAIDASVTSEDEIDGNLAYGVDYTVASPDLPVSLTLEDATDLLGADPQAASQLATLTDLGGDMNMTVTNYEVDASYHLDPERGVMTDSSAGTAMTLMLELSAPDLGSLSMSANLSVSSDLTLDESAPAQAFEKTGVFDRMKPDPFDVAASPLLAVSGYTFDTVDPATDLVDFSAAYTSTNPSVFAGYQYAWMVNSSGDRVLTISVANGGQFRGNPNLAQILGEYWSGASSTEVAIGDRTAYRVTVNGTEWLLWNSDTHLFVLIGPRAASKDLMQSLMETPPPYRWRTGDCLDFRDGVDDARPYAPFGEIGLAHCSAEHTFEVIYSEPMPEGADAPYPDDIQDRSNAACAQAYLDYTGTNDSLTTLIQMTQYLPDRDEWARGSRYLACGVYLVGANGTETVSGRLAGMASDHPLDMQVGLCMATDRLNPTVGSPVECTAPHTAEVIAELQYPAGPDEPLPAYSDMNDTAQGMCDDALDAYGPSAGPYDVSATPVFHSIGTWDQGERGFYCNAYVYDEASSGLVSVVGTFDGEWSEALQQGSA